ncbi:MAG: hypothetical protein RR537_08150, partial [Longicatena sp.]
SGLSATKICSRYGIKYTFDYPKEVCRYCELKQLNTPSFLGANKNPILFWRPKMLEDQLKR